MLLRGAALGDVSPGNPPLAVFFVINISKGSAMIPNLGQQAKGDRFTAEQRKTSFFAVRSPFGHVLRSPLKAGISAHAAFLLGSLGCRWLQIAKFPVFSLCNRQQSALKKEGL